jgi:hypothetical protein
VTGTDNGIYWRTYNVPPTDSWGNWNLLSGLAEAGPGAAVANNKLYLIVLGTDGLLYHGNIGLYNNAFNGWAMIDGLTTSDPTLTS